MDFLHEALIASLVTIVGMSIASMLTGFNKWKVFISSLFLTTIFSVIYIVFDRKSINFDVNGSWGEHGILPEILNPLIWVVSLGLGLMISLILIYAVYSSEQQKNKKT